MSFSWQKGMVAFLILNPALIMSIDYIKNQENHHQGKSFIDEYTDFLKKFGVEFDESIFFKPIE
jgi:hypothetical protein